MKPIEIKMKPTDVTSDSYSKPKFKVGDHVRIWKHKIIFAKWYTQNCSVEVFVFSKIKSTVPWTYVISIWMVNHLLEAFMRKNCKNYLKEKVINHMSNGKDTIIPLIVGLIKKTSYKSDSILS